MEWLDPREIVPNDLEFVYIQFQIGNVDFAQYKINGYPKDAFWYGSGKHFICKEYLKSWTRNCLKCDHLLELNGECAVCVHLM